MKTNREVVLKLIIIIEKVPVPVYTGVPTIRYTQVDKDHYSKKLVKCLPPCI